MAFKMKGHTLPGIKQKSNGDGVPYTHEYVHGTIKEKESSSGPFDQVDKSEKSQKLFGITRNVVKYVDPETGEKHKRVTVSRKNKDGVTEFTHKEKQKKDGKLQYKVKGKGKGSDYTEKIKTGRRGDWEKGSSSKFISPEPWTPSHGMGFVGKIDIKLPEIKTPRPAPTPPKLK